MFETGALCIGTGRHGWGRNKRWEYWGLTTPTHLVGVTVSSLDYAGVHAIWVHDRHTGETVSADVIDPLARGATLPPRLDAGPARARTRPQSIDIEPVPDGTRLQVTAPRLRLEVLATRPPGHEAMAVVVPWSPRLFQYTVKDVARPAVGRLWVDGLEHAVPAGESWAVLDHGRGRWPYSMHWNWGAGSGVVDRRVSGRRRPRAPGQRGARPALRPGRLAGAVAGARRARRPHLHAVLGPRLLDQPRRAGAARRPVLRALDRVDER